MAFKYTIIESTSIPGVSSNDVVIRNISEVTYGSVQLRPKYLRISLSEFLSIKLIVNWTIAILLEETPFAEPQELLGHFSVALDSAISNGNFLKSLVEQSNIFQNSTVTVLVSQNIDIELLHSVFPTSVPSGAPSHFEENVHFEKSEFYGYSQKSGLLQFSYLIGSVFFIFVCIPLSFYLYDLKGINSQMQLNKRIANKR